MKILDRYVLATFLKNYLISFMVLVGLYIVLDMVFNFDELTEIQATDSAGGISSAVELIGSIGGYYFYQMFLFFVYLSGIIPVVAAAFTLMRFSRFNELVAMLAAGVPLLRIAMPIILASLVLNVLLLVDQELLIPRMIPKLIRDHDDVNSQQGPAFEVQAMRDDHNALLRASRFRPASETAPATMEQMDLIERNDRLQPVAHTIADLAEWDEREQLWRLTNGRRVSGLLPDERRTPEKPVATYRSNITPDEISLYRSGNYVNLLSTERISQLLASPQSYGITDLLRVKHTRFTQPLCNVILLLLAIPCVLTREPGKLKAAAMKCVVLTGACMAAIFVSQNLAGNPPLDPKWANTWPALIAWTPIFLFAPLAIFLLDRVQTRRS